MLWLITIHDDYINLVTITCILMSETYYTHVAYNNLAYEMHEDTRVVNLIKFLFTRLSQPQ